MQIIYEQDIKKHEKYDENIFHQTLYFEFEDVFVEVWQTFDSFNYEVYTRKEYHDLKKSTERNFETDFL